MVDNKDNCWINGWACLPVSSSGRLLESGEKIRLIY